MAQRQSRYSLFSPGITAVKARPLFCSTPRWGTNIPCRELLLIEISPKEEKTISPDTVCYIAGCTSQRNQWGSIAPVAESRIWTTLHGSRVFSLDDWLPPYHMGGLVWRGAEGFLLSRNPIENSACYRTVANSFKWGSDRKEVLCLNPGPGFGLDAFVTLVGSFDLFVLRAPSVMIPDNAASQLGWFLNINPLCWVPKY